eukprot:gene2461-3197_t
MSDSKTDVKVLLVGDVCGKINALAKRITSVNKSNGPFDCCFCVGSFFGDGSTSELQPYLDGKSTLPIPVYFIDGLPGGSAVLESVKEDGVIFPNLTFLRGAGIRDLHGLRVAYLAGRYDALSFADQSAVAANAAAIAGEYRVEDVKALTSAAEGGPNFGKPPVDLFLSNEWGKGILYASPTAPAEPAHVLAALEQDASASSGQYWRWEDRAAKQIKQTPSSQVVAVRIRIGEDGRPAGHAHVQFESAEAAEEAVMLTGNELGGRELGIVGESWGRAPGRELGIHGESWGRAPGRELGIDGE